MNAAHALFRRRDGLLISGADGTHFVTDVSTGRIHELNQTAKIVFDLLEHEVSPSMIIEDLHAKFPEVDRGEIQEDVMEVLEVLVQTNMVDVRTPPAAPYGSSKTKPGDRT